MSQKSESLHSMPFLGGKFEALKCLNLKKDHLEVF